jgi:hypothetical protein
MDSGEGHESQIEQALLTKLANLKSHIPHTILARLRNIG